MKQKLEMQKNVQLTYAQIYNTYALAAFVHQYTTYVNYVFFFYQFQLFTISILSNCKVAFFLKIRKFRQYLASECKQQLSNSSN